jgi:hypothetical protein
MIHEVLLPAVQLQPACVVTVEPSVVKLDGGVWLVGVTV